MPPREVLPHSARKRKGEPCCLATSTRGHASITQTPSPALINGQGCIEREKSPPIENGQCQTIKNKSYQRAHPGRGTYTHQQLRSMPEQPRHSALHYLACSCPIKHETFNCPLTAPSCFVQVEKAKLPFNSRTGALTRYQGSSGSRERTSLLDSSPPRSKSKGMELTR